MEKPPLLDIMTRQIDEQCEAVVAEAQEKAQRIRGDAERKAEQQRQAAIQSLSEELETLAQRARESAEAEAEMVALTTKDTIADEVLDQVEAEVARLAQRPDFAGVLEQLLDELLPEAPDHAVVLCPQGYEEQARQWLANRGRDGAEVQGLPGLKDGVAVQDAKRTFRITNSLSTRLRLQEEDLRKFCLNRLFEGAQ